MGKVPLLREPRLVPGIGIAAEGRRGSLFQHSPVVIVHVHLDGDGLPCLDAQRLAREMRRFVPGDFRRRRPGASFTPGCPLESCTRFFQFTRRWPPRCGWNRPFWSMSSVTAASISSEPSGWARYQKSTREIVLAVIPMRRVRRGFEKVVHRPQQRIGCHAGPGGVAPRALPEGRNTSSFTASRSMIAPLASLSSTQHGVRST